MSEESKVVFLKGKSVNLRPVFKSDLPQIVRWINDPEVRNFLNAHLPQSEQDEERWLENLSKNKDTDLVLVIETTEGRVIGLMGLHKINWRDRVAITGALIGEKEYWGKGFGTDAKVTLLNYAFNTLNLHKICSGVIAFNGRSLQYSLHCGYKIEGRSRKQVFKRGKYWDLIQLGLFKNEWLPIWRHYQ